MQVLLVHTRDWLFGQSYLTVPLLLAFWIAWGDARTRRIPNYLTFGTALAGLLFQGIFQGWSGLVEGGTGLLTGFGLLFLPYVLGGMGAGDVKALAALGAWLGPGQTLWLFVYTGICGGVLAVGVLWWRGLLWQKLRQAWIFLINWLLCRRAGTRPPALQLSSTPGIPYGVALSLGMVILFVAG